MRCRPLSVLRATPRVRGTGVLALVLVLAGCASAPTDHGTVSGEPFTVIDLVQSDAGRMATLGMRDNLHSLFLLQDKLYKRNPSEWRKSAPSREAAIEAVRQAVLLRQPWAPLGERRDVAALSYALSVDFTDDRVAAFIYACGDMLLMAHGERTTFTLLNGLDAQRLYNAARNMEIAMWVLNSRRKPDGTPLLLANEISAAGQNLSFEREMGKIIGRLDLLATFTTEKYRRALINYGQNWMAGPLLTFLPVR